MYGMVFFALCAFFVLCLGGNLGKIVLNMLIRCLFCLICIYLCNEAIVYFGGNISVKINEITACVSAFLGISGVAALYLLQCFFTINS